MIRLVPCIVPGTAVRTPNVWYHYMVSLYPSTGRCCDRFVCCSHTAAVFSLFPLHYNTVQSSSITSRKDEGCDPPKQRKHVSIHVERGLRRWHRYFGARIVQIRFPSKRTYPSLNHMRNLEQITMPGGSRMICMTSDIFLELDLYDTDPAHLITADAGSTLPRSWSIRCVHGWCVQCVR